MEKNLLKGVKEKLRGTRESVTNVPYELHELTNYMSENTNDELVPLGMLMSLTTALYDMKTGTNGFTNDPIPRQFGEFKFQIIAYLPHFPLIIDKIADEQFATEFREHFEKVFGDAIPKAPSEDDYGCVEVEPGVVSISNKDKAEVLASLYNKSHPQGLGFLHFDSTPMSIDEAREILKTQTYFDYLKGRVMKVDLSSDQVNTWGYNRDNGELAAEKAIAACKNI